MKKEEKEKLVQERIKKRNKNLLLLMHGLGIGAWTIILVVSIYGLINSAEYFYIGYHNMDGGQNMRYLNTALNITLVDQYDFDKTFTADQAYIIGVKQIRLAFWGLIINGFFAGFSIPVIIYLSLMIGGLTKNENRKKDS